MTIKTKRKGKHNAVVCVTLHYVTRMSVIGTIQLLFINKKTSASATGPGDVLKLARPTSACGPRVCCVAMVLFIIHTFLVILMMISTATIALLPSAQILGKISVQIKCDHWLVSLCSIMQVHLWLHEKSFCIVKIILYNQVMPKLSQHQLFNILMSNYCNCHFNYCIKIVSGTQ